MSTKTSMHSSHINGVWQAPYIYAVSIEDHILINVSSRLPIEILAKELQEDSDIMSTIKKSGGNLYAAPRILLYCCQCTKIQEHSFISRRRLLDGLGAKLARLCLTRQNQLGSEYVVLSPLHEKSLDLLADDHDWIVDYAEAIFKSLIDAINSKQDSPIIMMSP